MNERKNGVDIIINLDRFLVILQDYYIAVGHWR